MRIIAMSKKRWIDLLPAIIGAIIFGGLIVFGMINENRQPKSDKQPSGDIYFSNCSEARAAGYENIQRGQAGYRDALDRDGDGYACEPYRQ
jgi:hypothetical protein